MKKILLPLLYIALTATLSYAHPPSAINLQYDQGNGKLLIDIKHLSRDSVSHYIKKVEIIKNTDEPMIKKYRQQVKPNNFYVEAPISAELGDVIKVKAYSMEGGTKEASLELSEDVLKQPITQQKMPNRSSSPHPKDKSKYKSAVPKDPNISRPTHPTDPKKVKPAFTRDPNVVSPAFTRDPKKVKPAFTRDPSVAKPTMPTDPNKIKPAAP